MTIIFVIAGSIIKIFISVPTIKKYLTLICAFALEYHQIQMIRDPERQMEMVGVPEEYLSGHAFHLYHLSSPDET